MDLFSEHGFEPTTVAEIAERAGLTERTFFRHFADKREVLFSGSEVLVDALTTAIAAAPEATPPLDVVATALGAAADAFFADRHAFARRRQAVITANAELRERELIKMAWLATAVADALRARGVADLAATLAAETGVAVFKVAFERWVAEPDQRAPALATVIRTSFDDLRAVATATR
jgi:AcrR family transcriptional regulator